MHPGGSLIAGRPRPRFAEKCDGSRDDVVKRARDFIAHPDTSCQGMTARGHIILSITDSERHVWSPTLDLDVREEGDAVWVKGRFGPSPTVWTFFVAVYATCTFATIAGLVLASAQATIGGSVWGLWIALAGATAFGLAWAAALVGQTAGHDQIETLRAAAMKIAHNRVDASS